MTEDWKQFLLDAGAEFNDDQDSVVSHFGNPERELQLIRKGTAFCDLSHYSLVRISGDDALTFLQGQLSNDMNLTTLSRSQLSAYCSPKGRVLAILRIINHGDHFTLIVPTALQQKITDRLQMFVMMSKVTINVIANDLILMGVSGPDAPAELITLFGSVPKVANDTVTEGAASVVRLHGELPRYLIMASSEVIKKCWNDLNVKATPVGAEPWSYLNILAGIPEISLAIYETQVPQMLNLDLLDAVNFKKGCYPGQEIVARMHYLGKLKKRLYFLDIDTTDPLSPGTGLYSPAGRSDEPVGVLIRSSHKPDGKFCGLGVLQKKIVEGGAIIHLKGNKNRTVIASVPEYEIETEFEF